MFGLDYLVSNIYCLLFYQYFDSDVLKFDIFQIHFMKKKPLSTDPQFLMQYNCCNCYYGRQLTGTHSIVCY